MSLAVPDTEEFGTFRGEVFAEGDESDRAEAFLQQAVDLIWILTGLETTPTGQMRRVYNYAVYDLALWLMSQADHREEINAPYSGERIGSYSYQKLTQQARTDGKYGVFWLDQFLANLNVGTAGSLISVSSENVFNPEGYSYEETRIAERWEAYLSSGSNYVLYENGR